MWRGWRGSSNSRMVLRGRGSVCRASAFAPCVLLLRDLEDLGGAGAEGGGGAAAAAQLADALGALVREYCSPEARRSVLCRSSMLDAFRCARGCAACWSAGDVPWCAARHAGVLGMPLCRVQRPQ
jgi:hypothetical protein